METGEKHLCLDVVDGAGTQVTTSALARVSPNHLKRVPNGNSLVETTTALATGNTPVELANGWTGELVRRRSAQSASVIVAIATSLGIMCERALLR
tara:strand:+ start:1089 stop:1376 length:288 start_codon:yes stop_codon:yes gene_type:complete